MSNSITNLTFPRLLIFLPKPAPATFPISVNANAILPVGQAENTEAILIMTLYFTSYIHFLSKSLGSIFNIYPESENSPPPLLPWSKPHHLSLIQ